MSIITKFMMTHLVMSILGIMVGLAVLTIDGESTGFSSIAIIASVFTIGFMCFMHYDDSFFCGVKEGIRAKSEGTQADTLKGLKIALIGYIPVFVVSITVVLLQIFNPENAVIPMLLFYFFQGSFMSLYALQDYVGVIGYVIISLLPAIISSTLGFAIGSKDKTLRGMMGMNVKPPFDGPLERKPKNKN